MTSVFGTSSVPGQDVSPGSNPSFESTTVDYQQYCEITTPTELPAVGCEKVYTKAGGDLYILDSAGTESKIGGDSFDQSLNTFDDVDFNTVTSVGPISAATPILGTDLATKDYVDGVITSGLLNWAQYADTQFDTNTRLTVSAQTSVTMPNNALNNITSYMPSGVAFYDGSKITPQSTGETYELRVNFSANSSTVNNYIIVSLDIGGTQGVILERTISFPRGNNIDHAFSTTSILFALNTFVTNGGTLSIYCEDEIDIWGVSYVIVRTASGNIDIPDAPNDGSSYARNSGAWALADLQSSYDASAVKKITTDATALTLESGVIDSSPVLEINNTSSAQTLSINGNGLITIGASGSDYILPNVRGNAGDVLTESNGTGLVGWAPPSSGGGGVTDVFSATKTATQLASNGTLTTIDFDAETYDPSGAFDPASGEFTAQTNGIHVFTASVASVQSGLGNEFETFDAFIYVQGVNRANVRQKVYTIAQQPILLFNLSLSVYMLATEKATLRFLSTGINSTIQATGTFFSGHCLPITI